MSRSTILHELCKENKKQAASKLLQRNEKFSRHSEILQQQLTDKLTKLIKKKKTLENRKFEHLKQQEQSRCLIKEKHEQKRTRAQSRIKEIENEDNKKVDEKSKIPDKKILFVGHKN